MTRSASMQAAAVLAVEPDYPDYIHNWLTRRLLLELQAGAWERVHAVRAELLQQAGARQDDELQSWLLHAEAAELHAGGDHPAAYSRLVMAGHRAPRGRARACAVLAAAWLQAERGHCADAGQLLQSVQPWQQEHPVGLATAARLAFAMGHVNEAVRLQRLCVAACSGKRQQAMVDLLRLDEPGRTSGAMASDAMRALVGPAAALDQFAAAGLAMILGRLTP